MPGNKKNIFKISLRVLVAVLFWAAVWQVASMFISDDLKLFLPTPAKVFGRWGEIIETGDYWYATAKTLFRIFAGFVSGVAVGFLAGILTATFTAADILLAPLMKIVRAVPVVSFIILAYLFMNVDGLPVFISFLMVVPMVWHPVRDGVRSADRSLCEMCRCFGLGKFGVLFKVRIPSCRKSFITSAVSALGFAWKSGVAAEVLCTPRDSLGHLVLNAKNNLDYSSVYALTLTVVVLSIVIELLFTKFCERYVAGKETKNA